VKYCKIFTKGHEVPDKGVVDKFYEAVFGMEEGKMIGVHCTHGLNRTGYLICRYMVEKMKLEPDVSIKAFDLARGHKQERENYLAHLRNKAWEREIENGGGFGGGGRGGGEGFSNHRGRGSHSTGVSHRDLHTDNRRWGKHSDYYEYDGGYDGYQYFDYGYDYDQYQGYGGEEWRGQYQKGNREGNHQDAGREGGSKSVYYNGGGRGHHQNLRYHNQEGTHGDWGRGSYHHNGGASYHGYSGYNNTWVKGSPYMGTSGGGGYQEKEERQENTSGGNISEQGEKRDTSYGLSGKDNAGACVHEVGVSSSGIREVSNSSRNQEKQNKHLEDHERENSRPGKSERERRQSGHKEGKPNLVSRKSSRDRSFVSSSRTSAPEMGREDHSSKERSRKASGEERREKEKSSAVKKESSKNKNERKRKRKKEKKKMIQTEGIFS